jgi:hypothetical protein
MHHFDAEATGIHIQKKVANQSGTNLEVVSPRILHRESAKNIK